MAYYYPGGQVPQDKVQGMYAAAAAGRPGQPVFAPQQPGYPQPGAATLQQTYPSPMQGMQTYPPGTTYAQLSPSQQAAYSAAYQQQVALSQAYQQQAALSAYHQQLAAAGYTSNPYVSVSQPSPSPYAQSPYGGMAYAQAGGSIYGYPPGSHVYAAAPPGYAAMQAQAAEDQIEDDD